MSARDVATSCDATAGDADDDDDDDGDDDNVVDDDGDDDGDGEVGIVADVIVCAIGELDDDEDEDEDENDDGGVAGIAGGNRGNALPNGYRHSTAINPTRTDRSMSSSLCSP